MPTNESVAVGESTLLCPCPLQTPHVLVKKNEFYLLKDDDIKIPMNNGLANNLGLRCPSYLTQSVREHTISSAKFEDEGNYQCVYHPKGISQPIKSPKWFLQVNGILNINLLGGL